MRVTDKYVFFWDGPFSNWHPTLLQMQCYDGVTTRTFPTSEHAYMYLKAEFFKDVETANLIRLSNSPRSAKALGRAVKNFNNEQWNQEKINAMYLACYAKFSQNKALKNRLLKLHGKKFVEASPYDCVWGVGLSEDDDRILDPKNWKGENFLGEVLTRVMNELHECSSPH